MLERFFERFHRESRKDDQAYEIKLDTPFKPYEEARKFFWPRKGKQPFLIPERHTYVLALRRKVSIYGIEGYIDVISEDPDAPAEILVGSFPLSKPLGDTAFVMDYRGRDNITYREQPYILRFGFPLRTPAEYSKLLNSYVDAEMGKNKYMLAWNLSIPTATRNMKRLEDGEEVIVVEKNLFDLKVPEEGKNEGKEEDDKDFKRTTFVWFPDELKKLRTITLTFHQIFDQDDNQEQHIEPIIPERERILVRVQ